MTARPASLRVMSWNVRDLLGDPLAVHRVVRAVAPDVVCFQEAPRRPGAALRLWLLGRGVGLRCVAGGRRSGGTAIFVGPRVVVDRAVAFRLPVSGPFTRTRGACVAEVAVPGCGPIVIASLHLPLQQALRIRHVQLVRGLVGRRPLPAVVTGDFNEPAGSPAWRAWTSLAADPCPDAGPTFPASGPTARIDAVLTGPGVVVTGYHDGGCPPDDVRRASDHLPVVAEITQAPR
jgi:endonuclease/exonuclease/phosphatase family metal-dependent hydrolase